MVEIEVDHEAQALYIRLLPRGEKIAHTNELQEDGNVLADVTEDGRVYGISIRSQKDGGATGSVTSTPESRFIRHLTLVGVGPRGVCEVIASIFFGGDIEDPTWLSTVLGQHASGYVTERQLQLFTSWWTRTRLQPGWEA